jgi:hypothetical protein
MPDDLDRLAKDLFALARAERPAPAVRERVTEASQAKPRAVRRFLRAAAPALALAAGGALLWRLSSPSPSGPSIGRESPGALPARAPSARTTLAPGPDLPRPSEPTARRHEVKPTVRGSDGPRRTATLGEELALLEQARSALERGSATNALGLLDRYLALTHGGRLAAEASVLRIEALVRAGRTAEAERLAHDFLRDNPNSPLADRARALSAGSDSTPK